MQITDTSPDFSELYNLEQYLFNTVHVRFRAQRYLNAFDFFAIVVWKANRAKSKIARRLLQRPGQTTLESAVIELTAALAQADSGKERLRLLFEDWHLRLPMASAVLTVLFPEDFTVYDVRVCGLLGRFAELEHVVKFEKLWPRYEEYVSAVREAVPQKPLLRDKDRYLWGRSFAEQLERDIKCGFRPPSSANS